MQRYRPLIVLTLGALGAIVAAGIALRGTSQPLPLAPRGGEAFAELVLPSARFRQHDPRWVSERLGGSEQPLGSYGCTVASVAMGLEALGVTVTPGELNAKLRGVEGYDARGRLRWAALTEIFPEVRVDWQRPLTHATLDDALRNGEPAVLRITLPSGVEHWVLLVGKRDVSYLVRDPLDPDVLTPLENYQSLVYAVRVLTR